MKEKLVPETALILRHGMQPVIRTIAHPPGEHPDSPLINTVTAVELITPKGSRWYGFERAWIGSDLRMHVAGYNPRNEIVSAWEDASGD